jgi:hypothetical protein
LLMRLMRTAWAIEVSSPCTARPCKISPIAANRWNLRIKELGS